MGKFDHIIIVSDIDRTFLGMHGLIARNLEALEFFRREGGLFTLATGREHFLVPQHIPGIEKIVNAPMIACNGAYMYDWQAGRTVWEEFLPEPEISSIVDAARAHSPDVAMRITIGESYVIDRPFPGTLKEFAAFPEHVRVQPYGDTPHGDWYKIAWTGPADALTALRPVVDAQIRDGCVSMLACPTILEVQSVRGTKGSLLPRLKTLVGREDAVVWAIGDYENDLAMLKAADRRAIPSNALDCLRELPGVVEVCHHEDGAIADLISHIERELSEAQ